MAPSVVDVSTDPALFQTAMWFVDTACFNTYNVIAVTPGGRRGVAVADTITSTSDFCIFDSRLPKHLPFPHYVIESQMQPRLM